jgi:hypothetical protein
MIESINCFLYYKENILEERLDEIEKRKDGISTGANQPSFSGGLPEIFTKDLTEGISTKRAAELAACGRKLHGVMPKPRQFFPNPSDRRWLDEQERKHA